MKKHIKNTISDLVSNFLYYDRKEDEDLPVGAIEKAVKSGEITKEEIISQFTEEIDKHL